MLTCLTAKSRQVYHQCPHFTFRQNTSSTVDNLIGGQEAKQFRKKRSLPETTSKEERKSLLQTRFFHPWYVPVNLVWTNQSSLTASWKQHAGFGNGHIALPQVACASGNGTMHYNGALYLSARPTPLSPLDMSLGKARGGGGGLGHHSLL